MMDSARIDRLIAAVPSSLSASRRTGPWHLHPARWGCCDCRQPWGHAESRPLSRLLYALASISVLEVKDGQFRNGADRFIQRHYR